MIRSSHLAHAMHVKTVRGSTKSYYTEKMCKLGKMTFAHRLKYATQSFPNFLKVLHTTIIRTYIADECLVKICMMLWHQIKAHTICFCNTVRLKLGMDWACIWLVITAWAIAIEPYNSYNKLYLPKLYSSPKNKLLHARLCFLSHGRNQKKVGFALLKFTANPVL